MYNLLSCIDLNCITYAPIVKEQGRSHTHRQGDNDKCALAPAKNRETRHIFQSQFGYIHCNWAQNGMLHDRQTQAKLCADTRIPLQLLCAEV